VAAASAVNAARTDDMARYEAATVFVTVTSQVLALRPSRQGIEVKPSGRLLSDLVNPFGSLTEGQGIPALVIARQTRSLMKWYRWVLPELRQFRAEPEADRYAHGLFAHRLLLLLLLLLEQFNSIAN